MKIKEQLKGTCVLNEKEGMGAEIVALYTEAGFENKFGHDGRYILEYYGEKHGDLYVFEKKNKFTKILTLSQLRDIVKGKQENQNMKHSISDVTDESKFKEFTDRLKKDSEPQLKAGDVVTYAGSTIIFTGGMTSQGLFICEDENGILRCYPEIRHPKDKTREKAEEIMKQNVIMDNVYLEQDVKTMLIEMAKWGQENK